MRGDAQILPRCGVASLARGRVARIAGCQQLRFHAVKAPPARLDGVEPHRRPPRLLTGTAGGGGGDGGAGDGICLFVPNISFINYSSKCNESGVDPQRGE